MAPKGPPKVSRTATSDAKATARTAARVACPGAVSVSTTATSSAPESSSSSVTAVALLDRRIAEKTRVVNTGIASSPSDDWKRNKLQSSHANVNQPHSVGVEQWKHAMDSQSIKEQTALDDCIRNKVACSTSTSSSASSSVLSSGSEAASYESLQALDERIRAKANNTASMPPPRTVSSSSADSRDSSYPNDTTLAWGSTMEATKVAAAPPSHDLSAMARSVALSFRYTTKTPHAPPQEALRSLEDRIRAKVNRSSSASSTVSRDSTISMLSTGSSKCAAAAAAVPTLPRAMLPSLEYSDSYVHDEAAVSEYATNAELQDLDRRIRAKVGRSLSSSSSASSGSNSQSVSSTRSAASSIALDSVDARDGPSRRLGRPGRRRGHGQHSDQVVVTTGLLSLGPHHGDCSVRPQNPVHASGDDDGKGDASEAYSFNEDVGKGESNIFSDATESAGSDLLTEKSIRRLEETLQDIELESGEHGNLAVAFAVEEEDDMYLPSAVEYDPDAKPPIYRNRRFRLYSYLLLLTVAVGAMGAVARIVTTSGHTIPPALPERATLGIREYVEHFIGSSEPLRDPTHPYSKALNWIQYRDVMALTPQNGTKFTQRFLAAYLYFGTSVNQPWSNGCGPVSAIADPDDNNDNECEHSITPQGIFSHGLPYSIAGTRWLGPDDECTWGGVTCDWSGNIRELQLSGSNMTGTFPDGIAGFQFLRKLTFSYGGLVGPLPSILGAMKHLETVELDSHFFSGPIPESWYHSRSLQRVSVGKNKLTGSIQHGIAASKDLREVLLFENELNGTIPSSIGGMSSLRSFAVSNNALSGSIPTGIGNMHHLAQLAMNQNKLTGAIPTEIGRTSLSWLTLELNQLNSSIPAEMSMLSELWTLGLSDNQMTGTIQPLVNTTRLRIVRIEDNKFSGTLPRELGRLKEMHEFVASGNSFTGAVPQKMCKLRSSGDGMDSTGLLVDLQLDCSIPVGSEVAEISCPDDCCTACCDADGMNCRAIQTDFRNDECESTVCR